ncbi:hypothetical protein [Ferruginibacter sp. HRS2-29]|uniref:hypothetical protein n=1 Tax=Ferruginibacter sp. HRS2-29 TaxID=2487334 RepID=UPI0020CBB4B1|nr:hypothetical protein [Ferruginibacter sp. HRS2-29]MCP9751439.1 hypothetical protein [Ferruginibacter sp. HRS2-29]
MNTTGKSFLQKLLVNKVSYTLLKPLVYIGERLKASRENFVDAGVIAELERQVYDIFSDEVVKHGPFKGMKFSLEAAGDSLSYSKLLGSYEAEIHPFILAAVKRRYDEVVNIGCHDGYYAVGMARLMPGTKIKAFDTDPDAHVKTKALAVRNGVEQQMVYGGTYTAAEVLHSDTNLRSFFMVDCEGAEKGIFTSTNAKQLRNADLVIELHLHLHYDLVEYFSKLFGETHDIDIVDSVDDHLKAIKYDYPELKDKSYQLKRYILQERPTFMQWIFLSAKSN